MHYESYGGFFVIKKAAVFGLFKIFLFSEEWIIMENNYLSYKGRPLVRCGNEMYYGSMNDKYIVFIRELASSKVNDVDVGTKFEIQLLYTDPDIKGRGKIVKSTERGSFSDAMEFAEAWLRANNKK